MIERQACRYRGEALVVRQAVEAQPRRGEHDTDHDDRCQHDRGPVARPSNCRQGRRRGVDVAQDGGRHVQPFRACTMLHLPWRAINDSPAVRCGWAWSRNDDDVGVLRCRAHARARSVKRRRVSRVSTICTWRPCCSSINVSAASTSHPVATSLRRTTVRPGCGGGKQLRGWSRSRTARGCWARRGSG